MRWKSDVLLTVILNTLLLSGCASETDAKLEANEKAWAIAFPDATRSIEQLLAEGDRVVLRETLRGTHSGPFGELPPTGRRIEVTANVIYRVADGTIAESWVEADFGGFVSRLADTAHVATTDEVAAVNAALAAHVETVSTSNIDANIAGFTADAVYMPPNAEPLRNRDELERLFREYFESNEADIEMTAEETVVSGDWAFQWGLLSGVSGPRGAASQTPMDWKFVYIYRREDDGSWKIARDIFNSNVPEN